MPDSTYRPVSVLAVTSLALALLSLCAFIEPFLGVFAVASILLSIRALLVIRQYELTGRFLAKWAFGLACATLLAAPAYWRTVYGLEAASGAVRLDFQQMVKSANSLDEFVGREVCLKGYLIPPNSWGSSGQFTEFHFSHDGSGGKEDGSIVVKLKPNLHWEGDFRAIAVSGRLKVMKSSDPSAKVEFVLTDAVVRPVRTRFQLQAYAGYTGFGRC